MKNKHEWDFDKALSNDPEDNETIFGIINRKKQGIDCSEIESAEIKQYLTELKSSHKQSIVVDIQELFPQEYEEYLRLTDMKTSDITPNLNSEIADETSRRCKILNDFSKKTFNRIFDEVITECGFNPKVYHSYAHKYF